MPFHVLISDNVDKRAITLLQEKPDLRVTAGGDLSRERRSRRCQRPTR
ncbi:MAG: hypothetical protein HND48_26575 [Chloroflexi bacterium]|nr:hypothetical protein [Chloroflexota bacterium]